MPATLFARPDAGENADYYNNYIRSVPAGDLLDIMAGQIATLSTLLSEVDAATAARRYAPGKWSLKEVIGHLTDTERVFAFRAMAFSRQEIAPLPSFDQAAWVAAANYDERTVPDLLAEWIATRQASLAMIRALPEAFLTRRGIASGVEFTVRAALCILPGHVAYHIQHLRTHYLAS
jgi:DinB superfamily